MKPVLSYCELYDLSIDKIKPYKKKKMNISSNISEPRLKICCDNHDSHPTKYSARMIQYLHFKVNSDTEVLRNYPYQL